ncbi:MAG: CHAT domain-containing protein [Leptolyngbya sp. BL-A-14]
MPLHFPSLANAARPTSSFKEQTLTEQTLEDQGQRLYDAGQFLDAIPVLQQLIQRYRLQGNALREAIALSNLSLIYQDLGQWQEAEAAITASLAVLHTQPQRRQSTDHGLNVRSDRPHTTQHVLAQVLDVQARLQFASGQLEQALNTWEQAATHYVQGSESSNALRCRINQAQVLQAMGLYRQAFKRLTEMKQTLETQPDSQIKLAGLQSLGDVMQSTGDPAPARAVLNQSLTLAKALRSPDDISAALLGLGNVAYTQQETPAALALYQEAAATAQSPTPRVKAQLNQLSLLIDTQQWTVLQPLLTEIQAQMDVLTPGRTRLYMQISFAQSLMKLATMRPTAIEPKGMPATSELTASSARESAARILMATAQTAANLGDTRTESHALGTLGGLYEQSQQWTIAQQLTQKALFLAQSSNASDISYRWQWQLGRVLNTQKHRAAAIVAYTEAVKTLRSLRQDLVATNPDVQYSFRESVEPIYRQLVELLLQPQAGSGASQANLIQARNVIESLQVAELENFFREACLDVSFQIDTVIDQATEAAAVLYPIILSDRLDVIVKLPRQTLRHYTIPVSQPQVEAALETLRQDLKRPYSLRKLQTESQQVYDWLIRPIEADLAANQTETLVFVLDGALRSIPMAALYDGKQYLIQKFNVALTPGLQLLNPRPLEQKKLQVLTAGLTESRHGLAALPNVNTEVSQIQSHLPGVVLLNQAFTEEQLQKEIGLLSFPIVHLATHGEFSSDPNKTFVAAWDQKIKVNQLDQLLRTREKAQTAAIELLVLSACETATGDKRAALGLAGVAIRAGARSTIASLWSLDDESSAVLMGQLYSELAQAKGNKANALRNAQLSLLHKPQYQHPRYWAPYVLIGNWL